MIEEFDQVDQVANGPSVVKHGSTTARLLVDQLQQVVQLGLCIYTNNRSRHLVTAPYERNLYSIDDTSADGGLVLPSIRLHDDT